jgi:hypothetical protein
MLSEQQLISCDSADAGCSGGDPPIAYAFAQKVGLATIQDYPDTSANSSKISIYNHQLGCHQSHYFIHPLITGVAGKCNPTPKPAVQVVEWAYAVPPCTSGTCDKQDEMGLKAVLATYGPLSVCVNAEEQDPQPDSADWLAYKGGILKVCFDHRATPRHCLRSSNTCSY